MLFAAALVFAAPPAPLHAAVGTGEIVRKLQARYDEVTTLAADFTQETKTRAAVRRSSGRVFFKKPGKMRWNYTEPYEDTIISDGRTIWVDQPDLGQVIERDAEDGGPSVASDFLTGVGSIDRDFKVTLTDSTGPVYRLRLTPRTPQPGIKVLFIEVEKESFLVTATVVVDPMGAETRVELTDVKLNVPLADDLFTFHIPEGVRVLRP